MFLPLVVHDGFGFLCTLLEILWRLNPTNHLVHLFVTVVHTVDVYFLVTTVHSNDVLPLWTLVSANVYLL